MKPRAAPGPTASGFALIIVLIVITVLGLLAGGFAYSMKVESRLAHNSSNDSELEWLGRSGVELARYVLGQSMGQPYTSLNQLWAGGPGGPNETNSVLVGINLQNNRLGAGSFSVKIRDLERKFNINMADEDVLRRAFVVMETDAADTPLVVDSILDWRDPDDAEHLNGTESAYYLAQPIPYQAKNGPIDDLAELLLVRGVTVELFWGPSAAEHRSQLYSSAVGEPSPVLPPVGLVDLFTALSNGQININTASAYVLQLLPGVDINIANNIIRARSGPDGVEGTEDDTPFTSPGMLNPAVVPGINPQMAGLYGRFCGVISSSFEVTVEAQIDRYKKRFVAIVRRNTPRDVPVVQFSWK